MRAVTYRILTRAEGMVGTAITSADNAAFKAMEKTALGRFGEKDRADDRRGRKLILEAAARLPGLCESLVLFDGLREDDDALNALIASFAGEGKLYILKKSLYNELDVSGDGRAAPLHTRTGDRRVGRLGRRRMHPAGALPGPGERGRGDTYGGGLRRAARGDAPRGGKTLSRALRARLGRGGVRRDAPAGPSIGELARFREEKGFELVALDRAGEPIAGFSFPKGFALLAGVEGPGLPDALRANAVSIPMEGGVESLNAAVAASIALYAWRSSGGH